MSYLTLDTTLLWATLLWAATILSFSLLFSDSSTSCPAEKCTQAWFIVSCMHFFWKKSFSLDVALSSTMTRKRSGPHGNVPNDHFCKQAFREKKLYVIVLLRRALLMEINAAKADFEVWKCDFLWLNGLGVCCSAWRMFRRLSYLWEWYMYIYDI